MIFLCIKIISCLQDLPSPFKMLKCMWDGQLWTSSRIGFLELLSIKIAMKSLLSSFIHWYPLENCTVFLWHGDDFIYCLLLRSTILIFFGLKVCSLDIYYTEKAKMNPPNNLGSLMETTMASALVIQLFDVGIFSFFLFIKEFHTVFCRLTGMMLSILHFVCAYSLIKYLWCLILLSYILRVSWLLKCRFQCWDRWVQEH